MSLFITFEGGDGGGKSTQAALLTDRLKKSGKSVFYFQEPGTTLLGRMLRLWLSDPNRPLTLIPKPGAQLSFMEHAIDDHLLPNIILHGAAPRAELLAFTIARAQLVEEYLIPHLRNNNVVVCNRFADSTVAYQGYGRILPLKLVEMANEVATQGIKPDLTVLLDIAPEKGLARKFEADERDHFEKQVLDFHRRVRQGYLALAATEPERWLVVDAGQPKAKVAHVVWERVSRLLVEILGSENQVAE